MIKKIALSFLSLALLWAHVSLHAIVTPLVLARQELVLFQKSIKRALVSYRNGQKVDEDEQESAQESSLAFCITARMPHALRCIPEHDLRNLHIAAVGLDTALSSPISDPVVREKTITNISRTLLDQSDELLCQLGAASKHQERYVSQQLSKQQKKLLAHASEEEHVKNGQRNSGHAEDNEQRVDCEQAPQEEGADIITWLTNNPEKVALGVAAVYGLLARYFDWPPFNKKDAVQQAPAHVDPQPVQNNANPAEQSQEADDQLEQDVSNVWPLNNGASQNLDVPQSAPEANGSNVQNNAVPVHVSAPAQPLEQGFLGRVWIKAKGLFGQ